MQPRQRYLNALSRQPVDHLPVWLMRQAGRYLPEYRALRAQHDFLSMCYTPELAVEVTLQPVRRFGVDAAIVFSDILLPAHAMGAELKFVEGDGPTFTQPIRSAAELKNLDASWSKAEARLQPVLDSLKILRRELGEQTGLIGFVGTPWTIAAYVVQGRGKQGYGELIKMKDNAPELLQSLLSKITDVLVPYVQAQVRAGCDAVQLFDTWGGLLSAEEFAHVSAPHLQRIVRAIQQAGGKAVCFLKERAELLPHLAALQPDALGIGYELDLASTRKNYGSNFAIQGNFNPELLLLAPDEVRRKTQTMLQAAGNAPGYIANLGHGVIKTTQPEAVAAFVDAVHEWKVSF